MDRPIFFGQVYLLGIPSFVISEFVIPAVLWFSFKHQFLNFFLFYDFQKKIGIVCDFFSDFFFLFQDIFLLITYCQLMDIKTSNLEIKIWDEKFNKCVTLDLKMLFQWGKKVKKNGLLKTYRPILGFYCRNSPQNLWFPNLMITFWNITKCGDLLQLYFWQWMYLQRGKWPIFFRRYRVEALFCQGWFWITV